MKNQLLLISYNSQSKLKVFQLKFAQSSVFSWTVTANLAWWLLICC